MLKSLLKSKYVLYQVSSDLSEVNKAKKTPAFQKFYKKLPCTHLLDN